MMMSINRRQLLGGVVAGGLLNPGVQATARTNAVAVERSKPPFRFCLNTSTIRGQNLSLVKKIEITADAGYQGIEPWIREIQQHRQGGGSLSDLRKRIADRGLTVESAIGFAKWIIDDDTERKKALEEARRDMELVRQIGGARIAAPPAGATGQTGLDLRRAAERYRKLLELGDTLGVTAQLEVWGFSQTLGRLSEAAFVAIESAHPKACLLPDVYHLYKGGSGFAGLPLISGQAMHVFHVNDYPANLPRETIRDADRVYCGDGTAPLSTIFGNLYASGFRGSLSLELFNPTYWKQDPLQVAKTGLAKTRAAVAAAFADEAPADGGR